MANYINIDETVKTFEKLHGEESSLLNCYNADWIVSFLEAQPTTDVVEVVRCKDCKHLMKDIVTEETPYGFDEDRYVFGCRKFFESSGEWVDVMLDDYCSRGRKEKR